MAATSGLSSGVSGSIWSGGRGSGTASGRAAGVASVSRKVDGPSQRSGSACMVESSLVSSPAGRVSISADSVVLVSVVLSGAKGGFGGSGS